MPAMSTPTPAEILAQGSLSRATGLVSNSKYIMDIMEAYVQANAPNSVYGAQPTLQTYNPPLHCEEAMLWHHLQNL